MNIPRVWILLHDALTLPKQKTVEQMFQETFDACFSTRRWFEESYADNAKYAIGELNAGAATDEDLFAITCQLPIRLFGYPLGPQGGDGRKIRT